MTTIERIIKLMEQNNIKDAELERMLGLKPKIVYGWKKGRSKSYMDFIPQLTQIFKVSPEYLLCLSDNESAYPLPPEHAPADGQHRRDDSDRIYRSRWLWGRT